MKGLKSIDIGEYILKSKIIAITIALALVLTLVFAVAGPVAASSGWNVSGNWVFDFILTGSNVDNYYNVTFAQTGTAITGTGEYPISGPPYSYTWNITGAVISGINFTATYTSGATGTVMQVTGTIAPNGSMSGTWSDNYQGTRTGTWSTTSGQATQIANTSDAPITGQIVAPTISMSAPGGINFQVFKFDVQKDLETSAFGSVTVVPNSANHVNWQVTASGAKYMVQPSVAYLIDPLYISTNNTTWATADAGITYNGTDSISNLDFYAAQTVEPADPAGTYGDTVTFAVAITSAN
jgi:hypothetical protein